VSRKRWQLLGLLGLILLTGCLAEKTNQIVTQPPVLIEVINTQASPIATALVVPAQVTTPAPVVHSAVHPIPPGPQPPTAVPGTSTGATPYGAPPPVTAEELNLTQKLFVQINQDRASRGLYPFQWNDILAGGARLHAWNMYHCGFSHYCPDGRSPCQRISDEGIQYSDCGENICRAGPYPTPWAGVYNIQEGMINAPTTDWHRIHLTSTTLHRIGVGVYVDPSGSIWFVEDMAS
jgi:uncharacterized protein YkwD